MENYSKVKSKAVVEQVKEAWDIIVGSGSKVKTIISKAMKLLQEQNEDKIVLTGFGPTVTKTITCAEIIKRRISQNMYQNNKLFYKSMEETWEPKQEGLDRLIVTRNVPAIKIVLSKAPLDVKEPGYQAPIKSVSKTFTTRKPGDKVKKIGKKQDAARRTSGEACEASLRFVKDKDKSNDTKRFKSSKEK